MQLQKIIKYKNSKHQNWYSQRMIKGPPPAAARARRADSVLLSQSRENLVQHYIRQSGPPRLLHTLIRLPRFLLRPRILNPAAQSLRPHLQETL